LRKELQGMMFHLNL